MDKKEVIRNFGMRSIERENSGTHSVLILQSMYEGEYGYISLYIQAELDGAAPEIHVSFGQTSGESISNLCSFRLSELQYFVGYVLPFFHPTKLLYEVPQSPAPDSQNP